VGRRGKPSRKLHAAIAVLLALGLSGGALLSYAGNPFATARANEENGATGLQDGLGPPAPAQTLSADQIRCGLTAKNVRGDGFVAVSVTDPNAEAKLSCLAKNGDHDVVGQFSHELFRSEGAAPARQRHERSYRWGMTALRNYLSSFNIDLNDPRFFNKYHELSRRSGPVNAAGFSDNIYYYSDVPIELMETGYVAPSASERRALKIIRDHRPHS
jgi:hypothetical protein